MPTLESPTVHQLAALVAVEREAASEYADAQIARRDALLIYGTGSDRYWAACQRDNGAMQAAIAARADVDQALAALAGVEVAA